MIVKPDKDAALLLISNPKSHKICLIPFSAWYEIPKTIKKTIIFTKKTLNNEIK